MGKIKANFQKLMFGWKKDGIPKKIKGDPSLCKAESSWKSTLKELKDDGEGYFVAPMGTEWEMKIDSEASTTISSLLTRFKDVF